MNWLVAFLLVIPNLSLAKKRNTDPNGYFKSRSWSLKHGKAKLNINSEYVAEPINTPNLLQANLHCPKGTKPVIEALKYCGIDSAAIVGGRLEILFVDFDPEHPLGYCATKRKQYFKIPKC